MPKYSFLLALLISASVTGTSVATRLNLNEIDTPTGKTQTLSEGEYDIDEQIADLKRQVEQAQKAKEYREKQKAEAKEKEAEKEKLLAQLKALNEEADEEIISAHSSTPMGENEVDLSAEKKKLSGSVVLDDESDEESSRNPYGLPEEVVNFVDQYFGGSSNPRGDVLPSIAWALGYKGIEASTIKMTTEYVVDGQTQVLTFPVRVHYNTADFNEVKLYASELTRSDENGSNKIHIEWKFQYNPYGNGNTLHPTHCYYTPGGKKPKAPNPGSNQHHVKNVLSAFGVNF